MSSVQVLSSVMVSFLFQKNLILAPLLLFQKRVSEFALDHFSCNISNMQLCKA